MCRVPLYKSPLDPLTYEVVEKYSDPGLSDPPYDRRHTVPQSKVRNPGRVTGHLVSPMFYLNSTDGSNVWVETVEKRPRYLFGECEKHGVKDVNMVPHLPVPLPTFVAGDTRESCHDPCTSFGGDTREWDVTGYTRPTGSSTTRRSGSTRDHRTRQGCLWSRTSWTSDL